MNHGIILHEEYRERMKKFSPERLGLLVQNMFRVDDGEEPLSFPDDEALDILSEIVCGRVKRDIENAERQRTNGSKGGAPIGNQNARKTTKNNPESTQKQPKNNPKQTPIPIPITNTYTNTNNKRLYGECENVKLTEEEHKKLTEKGYSGLIDELSLYIASKGDKYKDHYATVLSWARKREKERVSKNTFTRMTNRTDYDMDELERVLVKN